MPEATFVVSAVDTGAMSDNWRKLLCAVFLGTLTGNFTRSVLSISKRLSNQQSLEGFCRDSPVCHRPLNFVYSSKLVHGIMLTRLARSPIYKQASQRAFSANPKSCADYTHVVRHDAQRYGLQA